MCLQTYLSKRSPTKEGETETHNESNIALSAIIHRTNISMVVNSLEASSQVHNHSLNNFKGIRKVHVSQKLVPLHYGFMTLLCNYLCDTGYFL